TIWDARKSDSVERIRQAQRGGDLLAARVWQLPAVVARYGKQRLAEESGTEHVGPVGDAAIVLLVIDVGVGSLVERGGRTVVGIAGLRAIGRIMRNTEKHVVLVREPMVDLRRDGVLP